MQCLVAIRMSCKINSFIDFSRWKERMITDEKVLSEETFMQKQVSGKIVLN